MSTLTIMCFLFFFKQKTAYEIGLGIPAEPLFRSDRKRRFSSQLAAKRSEERFSSQLAAKSSDARRVGKECRNKCGPGVSYKENTAACRTAGPPDPPFDLHVRGRAALRGQCAELLC